MAIQASPFTLRPFEAKAGAEVRGIDLRQPAGDRMQAALNAAFVEHAVLVIRDQRLTPAQFEAAAQLFGEIMPQQLTQFVLPDQPLVGFISNRDLAPIEGRVRVRGENYHTDHSNEAAPPKATMLCAVELPSSGGDTQFVDTRAAYDDLSDTMKGKLAPLRSLHVYESSKSPRKMAKVAEEERAKLPKAEHPLVITHPDNGRKALYLNTGRMEGIVGMPDAEAFALIAELFEHATNPKYEYRHQWQPGDVVIWDNRSVMHQANADFDMSQYRYLYRVMLKGAPLR